MPNSGNSASTAAPARSAGLTIEDVERRVAEVQALDSARRDPEAAHTLEDALVADVVIAVAEGHPDAVTFAGLVLPILEDETRRRWAA